MKDRTYNGRTLAEIEQICRESEELELSIDELAGGGDSATSCLIIVDLVKRIRELEAQ